MMSSHFMMVLLVIMGYTTVFAVIIIAAVETARMDRGKKSLLNHKEHPEDQNHKLL